MFSGIRSMIFGYTDEPVSSNPSVAGSPGSDVSGVSLEQTLNAAATKFTEQLLPQQASIEELQSSSHQLLPTLNEQQHENELIKSHDLASTDKAGESEDEDEINVDSWELLDLIEKQTENSSTEYDEKVANSCTTDQQEQQLSKSLGGILKPPEKEQRTKQQQTRQKSKVSFETPDLVKNKHKNEPITNNAKPKQDKVVSQSKSKSSKKNKQTVGELVPPLEEDVVIFEEDPSLVLFPTSIFPYLDQPTASGSGTNSSGLTDGLGGGIIWWPKKQETLNYAAVLLTKPKEVEDNIGQSSVSAKPSGAVKRNRTVSMSSRSSNDDIDSKADADNESIMSSEFSDCDYGYGGLNDYVVRAKKSTKRKQSGEVGIGTNIATANSSARNVSLKRGVGKQTGKTSAASSANSAEAQKQPKIAKSKKKRVATSVSVSTDFLKQPVLQNKQLSNEVNSNDSSDVAEMDESWYVTPPPCFTGAKKLSADKNPVKTPIAAVAAQENALIEHPSIYIASTSNSIAQAKQDELTGKKASKKRASYAVSEPVSASSASAAPAIVLKKMTKKPFDEVPEKRSKFDDDGDSWGDTEDEQEHAKVDKDHAEKLSQQTEVVNRKASRMRTKSVSQGASLSLNKSEPAEKRAWRNKFIVDDWDLDDPEDVVSDFDDMFEPVVRKRKSSSGRAKRNKQQQTQDQQQQVRCNVEQQSKSKLDPVWDDDCDSVEMDPIKHPAAEQEVIQGSQALLEDVKENDEPPFQVASPLKADVAKVAADLGRKAPTPVRPIEPERKPGWQLRRRRSKRRPLAPATGSNNAGSPRPASSLGSSSSGGSSPAPSSARSSPSLIDRIGSSIVANLTNLTSGLVSAGSASPLDEPASQPTHQQHILAQKGNKLPIGPSELVARKQMSKGSLKRQNGLNMAANHSNRRPDRRLRMFARRNGCSINRKVQSNFH